MAPEPDSLACCPDLHDRIARLRALYERRAADRIFAAFSLPSPALQAFAARYGSGFCDAPDPRERIAFWDEHLSVRRDLYDDSVPAAYLSECDQGLYGGILGGEVRYLADPDTGWISSMVPPLLKDWSDFQQLRIDPQGPAFQAYRRQLQIFRDGAAGRFGLSHFILIDSLNFVYELVGATRTYLALYDVPELVRRAIDLAFELNVLVQETFFQAGTLVAGGTCSNMVEWIPGRIVSESVDPFHMTGVDDFETWGREPVERILGRFDGGVIHIHANGRHLLEAVSTVRGIKAVYLGDDRGFPPAFEILPEVRRRVGDLPLVVSCALEPFVDALRRGRLTGGVMYKVSGAPDADSANRLMERVRTYRA